MDLRDNFVDVGAHGEQFAERIRQALLAVEQLQRDALTQSHPAGRDSQRGHLREASAALRRALRVEGNRAGDPSGLAVCHMCTRPSRTLVPDPQGGPAICEQCSLARAL